MDLSLDDVFHIEKLHSERAKSLASEISNETARKILKTLYKNPASITDLSNKLDIPASTVQYHVNRLVELGVIRIAQKRLGKRLRDVKMYVYDKEGVIFFSSMEKQDFMDLIRKYILHTLRTSVPAFLLISTVFGLILAFIGSLMIKEMIRSKITSISMASGAGGIDLSFVLIIMLGIYLSGIVINILLLLLAIKKS